MSHYDRDFQIAKARRLRREGWKIRELIVEMRRSDKIVRQWVRGIEVPRERPPRKVTKAQVIEMDRLWASGKSLRAIAEDFPLTASGVQNAIRRLRGGKIPD